MSAHILEPDVVSADVPEGALMISRYVMFYYEYYAHIFCGNSVRCMVCI